MIELEKIGTPLDLIKQTFDSAKTQIESGGKMTDEITYSLAKSMHGAYSRAIKLPNKEKDEEW